MECRRVMSRLMLNFLTFTTEKMDLTKWDILLVRYPVKDQDDKDE